MLETFDLIAASYKKLHKLQEQRLTAHAEGRGAAQGDREALRQAQGRDGRDDGGRAPQQRAHRGPRRAALRPQPPPHGRRGQAAAPGRECSVKRQDFLKNYFGSELSPTGSTACASSRPGLGESRLEPWRRGHRAAQPGRDDLRPRAACRSASSAASSDGAARRARGRPGQEGDGRGQSPPRHLDRQEIHQSRAAVPRPHPGRQHRPDEGGRQVRVPPRLQVLDLCDLVDPPGDHPLDRRSGAHHPHPGAHDRDDQQAGPHLAPDAARDRPRADPGGARREAGDAARRRCARC